MLLYSSKDLFNEHSITDRLLFLFVLTSLVVLLCGAFISPYLTCLFVQRV